MSLQSRISELITAIGADIKELQNKPRNKSVALLELNGLVSAPATNLAASTFSALGDPKYRSMMDLRGCTKLKILGKLGGSIASATKIRIQYHTGGNIAIGSGDAGWKELATTAGSHTVNSLFYSGEFSVPSGAQIETCVIRAGLYGGDGVADPTLAACILNFYS